MALENKKENFSEWYPELLIKSEFVDYSAVSGCMVFRPLAYAVWEKIVSEVDKRLKKTGVKNVYFPLLIPERFLMKEQQHFKGFTPEVAWVTNVGKSKLDENLAIRPTSETLIYDSYSKWIRSWRDLPLRLNQWNNVVRWEFKHPTLLLRSREFLWNEGHTVFSSEKEAAAERDLILGIYNEVQEKYLALPGIIGRKTDKEKFAGAVASYSIEHIMPDTKAIQGPDFHFDGQNFAKAFDITFLDKNEKKQYVWQNTWAITTRQLGVLVATHSDNKGLVLPPNIAPIQIVIIPIFDNKTKNTVLKEAKKIKTILEKNEFSVELDDRDEYSPGWKFNDWELKGVPLRIEIGPKDIKAKKVVLVRRDTSKKQNSKNKDIVRDVKKVLNNIQNSMLKNAKKFLKDNIHYAKDYKEFKKILKEKGGIISAGWCGNVECEDSIKEETGAKITNIPLNSKAKGNCIYCRKKAKYLANFAKSY